MRYLRWWFEFIAQPLLTTGLFVTIFHFAIGPDADTPAGRTAFQFLLPGLMIYAILMQGASSTLYGLIFDKIEGALSDILMPPLTPGEFIAGFLLSALTSAAISGLIVMPIVGLAGAGLPIAPGTLLTFAVLGATMLALAGIIVSMIAKKWDQTEAFVAFGLTPMVFLSGVFAPIGQLPPPLPTLIGLNPLHYVVDGFRAGYVGVHENPLWLNLLVAAGVTLVLLAITARMLARGTGFRA